jgi:hypothetical protein
MLRLLQCKYLLFTKLYAPIWEETPLKPNVKNGLIFGGICGIAAILIWKFTLVVHPDPPAIDFIPFAIQLFVIHLIFGAFAAMGYRIR